MFGGIPLLTPPALDRPTELRTESNAALLGSAGLKREHWAVST